MPIRYVNTASTPGGAGTTNATAGADRAYATLAEALDAEQGDLTGTGVLEIRCCGTSPDTAPVEIAAANWTTTAADYIWIRGNEDEPNGRSFLARWSDAHYRLTPAINELAALAVYVPYTRLTGFQVQQMHDEGWGTLLVSTGVDGDNPASLDHCIFDGLFVRGAPAANAWFSGSVATQLAGRATWRNCIFVGGLQGGHGLRVTFDGIQADAYIENCVAANNDGYGINLQWNSPGYARNCYAGGNGWEDLAVDNGNQANNASEDGESWSTVVAFSTSTGARFANITPGSEDFAIAADSELIDAGAAMSGISVVQQYSVMNASFSGGVLTITALARPAPGQLVAVGWPHDGRSVVSCTVGGQALALAPDTYTGSSALYYRVCDGTEADGTIVITMSGSMGDVYGVGAVVLRGDFSAPQATGMTGTDSGVTCAVGPLTPAEASAVAVGYAERPSRNWHSNAPFVDLGGSGNTRTGWAAAIQGALAALTWSYTDHDGGGGNSTLALATFSEPAGQFRDIAGTVRPQGASWDIGAWEYQDAPPAGFVPAWAAGSNVVMGAGQ